MSVSLDEIATQCAPHIAPSTLSAIVQVESARNPFAIGVVGGRLNRQPQTLLEGVATVAALRSQGAKFSAGIAQIYVGNWQALGLDPETVFDPCANLRAAQRLLQDCFIRASRETAEEQSALRFALSCYYSGNFRTGFADGYVQQVVNAVRQAKKKPNF